VWCECVCGVCVVFVRMCVCMCLFVVHVCAGVCKYARLFVSFCVSWFVVFI